MNLTLFDHLPLFMLSDSGFWVQIIYIWIIPWQCSMVLCERKWQRKLLIQQRILPYLWLCGFQRTKYIQTDLETEREWEGKEEEKMKKKEEEREGREGERGGLGNKHLPQTKPSRLHPPQAHKNSRLLLCPLSEWTWPPRADGDTSPPSSSSPPLAQPVHYQPARPLFSTASEPIHSLISMAGLSPRPLGIRAGSFSAWSFLSPLLSKLLFVPQDQLRSHLL